MIKAMEDKKTDQNGGIDMKREIGMKSGDLIEMINLILIELDRDMQRKRIKRK